MKKRYQSGARRTTGKKMLAVIILTVLSLTACVPINGQNFQGNNSQNAEENPTESNEEKDIGFVVPGPESYDSADTAVVVEKNDNDNTVIFLNLELGRRYTLSMDGTTKLSDKYGESVSLEQIHPGDLVDITFLKSKKHLTTMQLSAKAWKLENVERYEINNVRGEVTIGEEVFKLTENTLYLSGGRKIEKMDLNPSDVLSFQGTDSQVVSVSVEKGHGYLRLVNDENFVGGWIEIGQSMIQKITEEMLLTVPEGSYEINISHNGGGGVKYAVINRNEETVLDIGDLEVAEAQFGKVLFSITPASAEIYIDGDELDASLPISLEYGLHQIIVRASGYKSITQYIRVGQESAGIDIVLDKADSEEDKKDNEDKTELEEPDASEDKENATGSYYKVYVDAPEEAEVYLDGSYVGISPCSFKKMYGVHIVTLRKSGYETRSYTVQIDDEEKDITFSFADLVEDTKEEKEPDKEEEKKEEK